MTTKDLLFLTQTTNSQQADYIAEYLPDDKTFEAKAITGTNLRTALEVFGIQLLEFADQLNVFANEMDPSHAEILLLEWERMLGIPDDCFQNDITIAERQRNALIKLAGMNVQTNEEFVALAAALGVEADIRSGIDSGFTFSGGDTEARFTIVIIMIFGDAEVFPYTFPIKFGSIILGLLKCIFEKVKPANCNVLFVETFDYTETSSGESFMEAGESLAVATPINI